VIEVNFTAMVRTLAILTPDWLQRGNGHFKGLSSLADDFYNPDAPSYTASKAGFSNYLVSMGLKLRSHGVYVTNIRSGFVDTKLPKASWKPLMMTEDQAAGTCRTMPENTPCSIECAQVGRNRDSPCPHHAIPACLVLVTSFGSWRMTGFTLFFIYLIDHFPENPPRVMIASPESF
jgi:NAD(P)-dependent dehydrogenase (short-subunit alcohol dehydrogenase family)